MEPSFLSLFEEIVRRYPGAPFFYQEDSSITFERTKEATFSLASFFQKAGVKEGDVVAIKAKREFTTGLALYATQCLGAIALPYDPKLTPEEIEEACQRKVYFVEAFNENAAKARYFIKTPKGRLDYLSSAQRFPSPDFKPVDPSADAIWAFDSKGRIIRHSQTAYISHLTHYMKSSSCICRDNLIALVPFHGIFGLSMLLLSVLIGYTLHIPDHFDKDHILDYLFTHRINILDGTPSLHYELALRAKERNMHFPNLRNGLIDRSCVDRDTFRFIEETMGLKLIPIYGTSECISASVCHENDEQETRLLSAGKHIEETEILIVDPKQNPLPAGETGEMLIRTDAMMEGYLKGGDNIDEKGFLHTGETGSIDEKGYLHIDASADEIESVRQIEKSLMALPIVEECYASFFFDAEQGKAPSVLLSLKEERSEEEIRKMLDEALPKELHPKKISIIPALPKLPSGKIDRAKAKELLC